MGTNHALRSHLALVLAIALLLTAMPSGAARAQGIPIKDGPKQQALITQLIGKLGEVYMTAVKWRDAMVEKSHAMIARTRQLVRLRHRYEQRAVGELGKFGEPVPDWRNLANVCTVDVAGTSACTLGDALTQRFELVLDNTFRAYRDSMFMRVEDVRNQVNDIVGRTFTLGKTAYGRYFTGNGQAHLAVDTAMLVAQGQTALELQDMAAGLNALVDTALVQERLQDVHCPPADSTAPQTPQPACDVHLAEKSPLSHGRAVQIAAALSIKEADAMVASARERNKALDLKTVATADKIRQLRLGAHTLPAAWQW